MSRQEFEEWLMNLPLQTLTDELKEDILQKVDEVLDDLKDDIKTDGMNE